ncbi:hypothetical protein SISNIDRAFT_470852 [Sistotremastrum niveocremeum HHB9708]|uniref:Uncharacterized protein n=1 Tax=Sistotremastrum niveocremeum HHB9708 TaxID=1314777 RepID=A0A164NDI0_9AGAM|nr:hypothetical protein SISNIDRAFT_470852 [Sistotremastrum niveocremeum HHB9708]
MVKLLGVLSHNGVLLDNSCNDVLKTDDRGLRPLIYGTLKQCRRLHSPSKSRNERIKGVGSDKLVLGRSSRRVIYGRCCEGLKSGATVIDALFVNALSSTKTELGLQRLSLIILDNDMSFCSKLIFYYQERSGLFVMMNGATSESFEPKRNPLESLKSRPTARVKRYVREIADSYFIHGTAQNGIQFLTTGRRVDSDIIGLEVSNIKKEKLLCYQCSDSGTRDGDEDEHRCNESRKGQASKKGRGRIRNRRLD